MKELVLLFNNAKEYERAQVFFESSSAFLANEYNDAMRAIIFNEETGNVNALERAISEELADNGFDGFWFE